jgi:hypothetical protein
VARIPQIHAVQNVLVRVCAAEPAHIGAIALAVGLDEYAREGGGRRKGRIGVVGDARIDRVAARECQLPVCGMGLSREEEFIEKVSVGLLAAMSTKRLQ